MNLGLEDWHRASTEETSHTLLDEAATQAAKLGFEYIAYLARIPFPISAPRMTNLNNHPAAWDNSYRRNDYLAIDPTFSHALHSNQQLIWSQEVFAQAPQIYAEARENGLEVGWAQPVRDGRNIIGLLTLARSGESLQPDEIEEKSPKLRCLAYQMHDTFATQLGNRFIPGSADSLSPREIDVLRWTAEGKTAHEVSRILGISERTVNFHANNATSKLGVSNKTAAAVHAALLGLF